MNYLVLTDDELTILCEALDHWIEGFDNRTPEDPVFAETLKNLENKLTQLAQYRT